MRFHEQAPTDLRWVDGREIDLAVDPSDAARVLQFVQSHPLSTPDTAIMLGLLELVPMFVTPTCDLCGFVARTKNGVSVHKRVHTRQLVTA